MKNCIECGLILKIKSQKLYCSNKCQFNKQYKNYIIEWRKNNKNGGRSITTRNISKHLKRYLLEKLKECCSECGWNKKHPKSGKVPLEIDHIDGNSENNMENNLKLLCPNCHALTPNFKNLNRGRGRKWRMKKYLKN